MSVFNIAEHILSETGPLSPEQLERLVYFAQEDVLSQGLGALFAEPIEAWDHGPVCPTLYFRLQGHHVVRPGDLGGVRSSLEPEQARILLAMLGRLGRCSAVELDAIACGEAPWQHAHGGTRSASGSLRITEAAIAGANGGAARPLS